MLQCLTLNAFLCVDCDQLDNKGAFIRFDYNLNPKYTSFTSVVSVWSSFPVRHNGLISSVQPHPPVKPMAYARPFMPM